MLTIRLRRKGKKNQPFFRVVVIDKRRSASGGNAVEILGNVDPLTKKRNLKKERILYWISKGAQPTATVHNILVSEKIIDAKKIAKKSKPAKSSATAEQSGGPATIPPQADLGGKSVETKPTAVATAPAETKPVEVEKPAEAAKEEPAQNPADIEAGEPADSKSAEASVQPEEVKPEPAKEEPAQNPADIEAGEPADSKPAE